MKKYREGATYELALKDALEFTEGFRKEKNHTAKSRNILKHDIFREAMRV